MRIIIAEADQLTSLRLAELTQQWGCEALEVIDGLSALTTLPQPEPVVLILGLESSVLTRENICREAKALGGVYVLLLSSAIDIDQTAAGILAGADDYISSPVDATELRIRLDVAERVLSSNDMKFSHALACQLSPNTCDENSQIREMNRCLQNQLDGLHATFDGLGAYVYTKDMKGRYTYVNQKVCELFNCSPADILNHDDSALFSLELSDEIRVNDALVLHQGETMDTEECNVIAATGETRYYTTIKKPLRGLNEEVVGLLGVSTDITQRKESEMQLRASQQHIRRQAEKLEEKEELYNLVFENSDDGVLLLDLDEFRYIDCNQQALKMLGFSIKADILSKLPGDISPRYQPDGQKSKDKAKAMCTLAMTKGGQHFDWQHINIHGELIWAAVSLVPVLIKGVKVIYVVWRDIHEQKILEAKQRLSARVFNDAREAIVIIDSNKRFTDVNPAFTELMKYSLADVVGKGGGVIHSDKHTESFYQNIWQCVASEGYWRGEVWYKSKCGGLRPCLLTVSSILNDDGIVVNYLAMIADIRESKAQQETLKQLAHYDPLTGLPNRALFADRFQQAVAQSKRSEMPLAVCFMDLDSFKPVNDNFGHDVGDKVLKEVARRISMCIREEDTVSRQGGDEFALLLAAFESASQCEQVVSRILKSLAKPYLIDSYSHSITASCGVALYPNDHEDLDGLMRQADQAMYLSKRDGKNQLSFFDSSKLAAN